MGGAPSEVPTVLVSPSFSQLTPGAAGFVFQSRDGCGHPREKERNGEQREGQERRVRQS